MNSCSEKNCAKAGISLAALRRGFRSLIRNDLEPVVLRLTWAEGNALPHRDPAPPEAVRWMAVGLDVAGRGTWSTTWSVSVGLSEEEQREVAELRALEALAKVANVRGLPAEAKP
jgi:hypothetical protein